MEREALDIYTTIHRRYVQSDEGLRVLVNRFKGGDFGKCHCWRCEYTCLLPVGLSHERNVSSVKLFCPCCKEIYNPAAPYDCRHDSVALRVVLDGAFFGREMASLFLTSTPTSFPPRNRSTNLPFLDTRFILPGGSAHSRLSLVHTT